MAWTFMLFSSDMGYTSLVQCHIYARCIAGQHCSCCVGLKTLSKRRTARLETWVSRWLDQLIYSSTQWLDTCSGQVMSFRISSSRTVYWGISSDRR